MKTKRYHLIIEIYDYPYKEIKKSLIGRLLLKIPPLINMRIIAGPVVVEGTKKNPGLSGFVIIDYSHISVHTFSRYGEVLVDIFSCKPYDKDVVITFLMKLFKVERAKIKAKTIAWG